MPYHSQDIAKKTNMNTLEKSKIMAYQTPENMEVSGIFREDYATILTPVALRFLARLHKKFNEERKHLLIKRRDQQQMIDNGQMPTFREDTKEIRESDWAVAPLPPDLLDRRVEITGPVDRKMMINALNSGANIFMADFEDSNTPSWSNCMEGQINLRDAIQNTITFEHPTSGKSYKLNEQTATLMVRPRGWHLEEKHIVIDGEAMSASLVDFGLYFFHNAKTLLDKGSGPYFYLPKLENHLEARLWNDVFVYTQEFLGVAQRSIKATVLIETIMASFEMHEILHELKDHSAGLNCGRWDYIFSFIKRFRNVPGCVFPDRDQVTMSVPFMRAYTQLVVKSCHQRGVHAIGGMAAQIPIKHDPDANAKAIEKVKADKIREVKDGHDGTWVAHPGLVAVAKEIFDAHMPNKNQISNKRKDVEVSAKQLIEVPAGTITEVGLRKNINVGILYIESWLRGNGAAALYHLMEDAATAEISRSQIWQWIRNNARLEDGRMITYHLYSLLATEEMKNIKHMLGEDDFREGRFEQAAQLFDTLIKTEDFIEFLTIPAYKMLGGGA